MGIGSAVAAEPENRQLRQWIDSFKSENLGPFKHIRWFCSNGEVLPPGENVCSERGGGNQHGVWGKRAAELRNEGYLIANVLAAISPKQFAGSDARLDDLTQILLEQFLIRIDDGWVFRRSRFFNRGAVQIEDEHVAATRILLALLDDPLWRTPERFLLLREAVRMLPLPGAQRLATRVRQLASEIADHDRGFQHLRVKIHSLPDAQDASRVREYADRAALPEIAVSYEQLEELLDMLYAPRTAWQGLAKLAGDSSDRDLIYQLKAAKEALHGSGDDAAILAKLADQARQWRQLFQTRHDLSIYDRLRLLQASLIIEQELFVRANRLLGINPEAGRAERIAWLRLLGTALYGTGLISERQRLAFQGELDALISMEFISAAGYLDRLRYLARLPQWSQQSLAFHFGNTVDRWSKLTPLAARLVPDRLRESPLLPFSRILDQLMADASRLAGIQHTLFGEKIDSNLRALNPGLKRGVLLRAPAEGQSFRSDGIYLLPSTTQDLTPVAGIITSGEGSSLSHVQLLARNMGIPNIVADEKLLQAITRHIGETVVLAVSRRGAVSIQADSPQWQALLANSSAADDFTLKSDPGRLNLDDRSMHALRRVSSRDSGITVGPKAANLGELRSRYAKMVAPGLVIPFGIFRRFIDRPLVDGGPPVFTWMQTEYARLSRIEDEALKREQTSAFLSRLRSWIVTTDPGAEFRKQLHFAYVRVFGKSGDRGVFVRSDTNVEDLPGFSGAGLNLTLPNVVGMDAIVAAIQKVWASPFSERAYAWRQSHMSDPENLYPAVLLLQSVDSEKSGVMVTADVDRGDRDWLSIAVSEGVGGAVEGQAAEEIRVERATGKVRLMAQATAPDQRRLVAGGGIETVRASGRERVLSESEIEQLRDFAAEIERRFPIARDESGRKMAIDIEFGFASGKLILFQLRPFVESRRAKESQFLIAMDKKLERFADRRVALSGKPESDGRWSE